MHSKNEKKQIHSYLRMKDGWNPYHGKSTTGVESLHCLQIVLRLAPAGRFHAVGVGLVVDTDTVGNVREGLKFRPDSGLQLLVVRVAGPQPEPEPVRPNTAGDASDL